MDETRQRQVTKADTHTHRDRQTKLLKYLRPVEIQLNLFLGMHSRRGRERGRRRRATIKPTVELKPKHMVLSNTWNIQELIDIDFESYSISTHINLHINIYSYIHKRISVSCVCL